MNLSAELDREGEGRDVPDADNKGASSPPRTASTVKPLYRSLAVTKGNGSTTASPGMSRSSSYTSAPSVTDSIASLGSSVSLGTIPDDLALSPRLAVGDNAAILAGDEEDEDGDMCPTIRIDRAESTKSPLS